jgi:hypothetical protein
MPRKYRSPLPSHIYRGLLTPDKGGTGQTTAEGARQIMGMISAEDMNKANGLVELENGIIKDQSLIANLKVVIENLDGPKRMLTNSTAAFRLTAYDSFSNYSVKATAGSVTIREDIILYKAPNTAGTHGFILNNRQVPITVVSSFEGVSTPIVTIIGNADGVYSYTTAATIVIGGSAFVKAEGATGTYTHTNSELEVSNTSNFAQTYGIYAIQSDKTKFNVTNLPQGLWFVRLRYTGTASSVTYVSDWSDIVHFWNGAPT